MFSATVYDTTLDWLAVFDSTALLSVSLLPFRLASNPEYRLCGRSLRTAMPSELGKHPEQQQEPDGGDLEETVDWLRAQDWFFADWMHPSCSRVFAQ